MDGSDLSVVSFCSASLSFQGNLAFKRATLLRQAAIQCGCTMPLLRNQLFTLRQSYNLTTNQYIYILIHSYTSRRRALHEVINPQSLLSPYEDWSSVIEDQLFLTNTPRRTTAGVQYLCEAKSYYIEAFHVDN